jgi:hypothetical protein
MIKLKEDELKEFRQRWTNCCQEGKQIQQDTTIVESCPHVFMDEHEELQYMIDSAYELELDEDSKNRLMLQDIEILQKIDMCDYENGFDESFKMMEQYVTQF